MKKLIIILASLFAALCLAGCSAEQNSGGNSGGGNNENGGQTEETDEDVEKILVAYFSCTGTTEKIAGYIADEVGAVKYRITPADPYTEEDLNYEDENSRATVEQAETSTARPEIEGSLENAESYTTIYIGYPIWWGRLPKIIYTFLEAYDFSDKVIIPFCTSGGSGIGVSVEEIKVLEPAANVLSGRRFSSSAKQSDVTNWLYTLNYNWKEDSEEENMNIAVSVGEKTFSARLYNTAAAKEFKKLLPLTLNMSAMEHEKYYYLDKSLTSSDEAVENISAGDIMLFSGNCIVLFYEDFSTEYSYTKIGKLISSEGLTEALGEGEVTITFSAFD